MAPERLWVRMDRDLFTPDDAYLTSEGANDGKCSWQIVVPYVLAEPALVTADKHEATCSWSHSTGCSCGALSLYVEPDPVELSDEFDIKRVSENLVSYTPKRKQKKK